MPDVWSWLGLVHSHGWDTRVCGFLPRDQATVTRELAEIRDEVGAGVVNNTPRCLSPAASLSVRRSVACSETRPA
jgi:hypothetical protein